MVESRHGSYGQIPLPFYGKNYLLAQHRELEMTEGKAVICCGFGSHRIVFSLQLPLARWHIPDIS